MAKDKAREAVGLLEQARELLAEDDSVQPSITYLDGAIREAELRASLLEDWYQRTYTLAVEKIPGKDKNLP